MGTTTSFYAPPDCVRGDYLQLPEEEAEHAARVLRIERGDEVEVVDGAGTWYRVRLEEVGEGRAAGHVVERRTDRREPGYRLVLVAGLLKKRSRWETMLEKAVELGAGAVRPLTTRRTEKTRMRRDRCRRVMIAALKQCRRCRLPDLPEPVSLEEYLEAEAGADAVRLFGEQPGETSRPLRDLLPEERPGEVRVLFGPEGGFASEEIEQIRAAGYRAAHVGPRRLRGETAVIAAAATVSARYE